MIIKNVSGSEKTLVLGRKTVVTLANNGSATIPDSVENMATALALQAAGTIEITESFSGSVVLDLQDSPQHILVGIADAAGSGDGKTLTIGTVVFEFDDDDTITAGRTAVEIDGADSAVTAAALKTAINANATLAALGIVATDVIGVSATSAFLVVEVADTVTLSGLTVTASAAPITATKVSKVTNNAQRVFFRQFTAAATTQHVVTGLTTIRAYTVQVRDATGVIKAYDAPILKSGGTLRLTAAAGVNIAATDLVTVWAVGE